MINLLQACDKYKKYKGKHLFNSIKQYLYHSTSLHLQGNEYKGKRSCKKLYNDRVIYDKPFHRKIGASINLMISNAKTYIYICGSDAFEPNDVLTQNLLSAAKKGVKIYIAYRPYIYNSNIHKLYENGVKLHCCLKNNPHSKIVIVDNDILYGSMNLTDRSLYMDYENAIYIKNNRKLSYTMISFIKRLFTSAYSSPYQHIFGNRPITNIPLTLWVSFKLMRPLFHIPFLKNIASIR